MGDKDATDSEKSTLSPSNKVTFKYLFQQCQVVS